MKKSKSKTAFRFKNQLGLDPPATITPVVKSSFDKRSRFGCAECKRRRVKCDETFPVCLRCQRRGTCCEAIPRARQWQVEIPRLPFPQGLRSMNMGIQINQRDERLLRYWLENASQMMVIDPDVNPMSFPILEHIQRAPSLLHALISLAAAHLHFFNPSKLTPCLEERGRALSLARRELGNPNADVCLNFMTVMMLGISESWITNSMTAVHIAEQHLRAARVMVDMALAQDVKSPLLPFILGAYLYWDMSCAFQIPSHLQLPLNTPEIYSAVLESGQEYHAMGGYSTEIFYLLGTVGRYCRQSIDTGVRDMALEVTLEHQLLAWEPNFENHNLGATSDAYRHHGLIYLAALSYRSERISGPELHILSEASLSQSIYLRRLEDLSSSIRARALTVTRMLAEIPSTHSSINFQGIPLFTAGSELTMEDKEERNIVRKRFQELYSLNHLRINLSALRLLEEIWRLRDIGDPMSWMDLILRKEWFIMLG
ncbi:fungal-specific transcription factor domain-containing protein [Mariannaea sp. PMI_226]|nr:fungal-specific transcription factor domain-containing protein [Mariannaea sp. PMI_226]